MQLRKSVYLVKAAALASAVVIIVISALLYTAIENSSTVSKELRHLGIVTERLLEQEERFLDTPSREHLSQIPHFQYLYQTHFNEFKALLTEQSSDISSLHLLDEKIRSFINAYTFLGELQTQLGFSESEGVYGDFRRRAHALQKMAKEAELIQIELLILELRRREKDYLLRHQNRYLTMHKDLIEHLSSVIEASSLKEKSRYLKVLMLYERDFNAYVTLLNQQGLDNTQGVRAQLSDLKYQIKVQKEALAGEIQASDEQSKHALILFGLIFIVLANSISLGLVIYQNSRVSQSIFSINKVLRKVAKLEDFSFRANIKGSDEIAQIGHDLDELLTFIETLLSRLSSAQQRLIEEARMTSLGSMVSGFAHELNTPLGVAITSQSHLKEQVKSLKEDLERGKLQRQSMTTLVAEAEAALYLLENNLHRTASLVDDFKQVAVDQHYEELSEFNLKHLVNSVFECYHSELPDDDYSVSLEIPEHLNIISFASVFTQVVGYCINNSIKHGKVEGKPLHIVVSCMVVNDYLHFYFKDDGMGIDKELLPVIFEPFVTSKRNAGGTGLGLSIVYNLVTQKLLGEVKMQSPAHGGACLHIILPETEFSLDE